MSQGDPNAGGASRKAVMHACELAALEEASRPSLDFPADFLRMAATSSYAGTTINGEQFPAYTWQRARDESRG